MSPYKLWIRKNFAGITATAFLFILMSLAMPLYDVSLPARPGDVPIGYGGRQEGIMRKICATGPSS